jgi:small subunit ribosomal protein S9
MFFEGIGRRKTSLSRVRFFASGDKSISINDKNIKDYFPTAELQEIVSSPLEKADSVSSYKISVKVKGGGIHSQAEAVRHGIARALILFDPNLRGRLRSLGLLTRDSRMRERKHFGLKRARRAPQWRKR